MASVKRDTRDGRWLARWRDPSGRQRKKSFARKVDAERFLAETTTQMNRGSYIDPSRGKLRIGPFAEEWLRGQVHLKASTRERYGQIVRAHILPTWATWPLANVATSDIAGWVGELAGRGSAPGTVRKAYRVFSLILDAAVNDGRLPKNPAHGVHLPRQASTEPRFLDRHELIALADAAGAGGLQIMVLGLTGLRFGEFAALRVKRLDVPRCRLVVAESVSVVGSELVWTTPKTHRGRSVPVPHLLMDRLSSECVGKDREDLVFTAPRGGAIRLNNWRRRVFEPACEKAGLSGLRVHDLRHTAASLAIAAGANVKAVQRMLGHASASMTLDIYAGLFPDDLDAVGVALNELVTPLNSSIKSLLEAKPS